MARRKTKVEIREAIHRDLGRWFETKVQQLINDMEMRCRLVDMTPDEFHGILMAEFADRVVQLIAALGNPDQDRKVLGVLYNMIGTELAKRARENAGG